MKRFEFRLHRTMDWRKMQADAEKSELERLRGRHTELSESRSEVAEGLTELSRQQAPSSTFRAEDLHQQAMFTHSLFNLDRRLAEEQTRCEGQITQQVQRCVVADRDHRLLQKLHDASHRAWVAEVDREVESTAADTWNALHGRKPGSSR